ncbi:efflux transporter outer membrane subunit [Paraburkholderia sp. NMBU_R16]|uniref:efflux transporter outer membrane subunit n=1 Tax=Paraburkholderia sp. NMBU_R16 TaxID=2698676 RepID=UPI001566B7ED|nr:efflux transporter outer membrane subunit [Paraburkholderia sp. NMBU_R16]NRO98980.1 efflux transporter outer membrane subunit [Paraburkholderia sp. NMBU_R16]
MKPQLIIRALSALALTLGVCACTLGPDYRKPDIDIPTSFKEQGTEWLRADPGPQQGVSGQWWLAYGDDELTHLIETALRANQSIASAQAAYLAAKANLEGDRAGFFPTLGLDFSASRGRRDTATGLGGAASANPVVAQSLNALTGVHDTFDAAATASWEPDLWGKVRRQVESGKAAAQSADATLAGVRLSIAASVASDYFQARQLDIDIALLKRQQKIDMHLVDITLAAHERGVASDDNVLAVRNTLDAVTSRLQTSEASREQAEHAIAALIGVMPAQFSLEPRDDYSFRTPVIPDAVPSTLLKRRPDVVSAERMAASANAQIGVAQAAFFPSIDLSADGGFEHNTLAHLLTLPNRIWTLGPDVAATLLDGGARKAALHAAQANYDEQVANYRQTVLNAFQSVEDNLSSLNHQQRQTAALERVFRRNEALLASARAQFAAGTMSEANMLNQEVALLGARQDLSDAKGTFMQQSVGLVKNIGAGWAGLAVR